MKRLARSAEKLDQSILAGTPKDVFVREAQFLQQVLTDSVMDQAVAALPAALARLERDRAGKALKLRRDRLVEAAGAFHELIQQAHQPQ